MAPAASSSAYAAGTTYYVSKSGSDTGNGSAASPWATIQKAVNTVGSGDIVHVAAGTYNERVTVPTTKSGTASAKTRFIADGKVVVSQGFVVDASHTDLTGFEVTPGASGLAFRTGQIQVNGDYNTLSAVNVHDIASGSGIGLPSGASYNTITNSTVHRAYEFGITARQSDHTTVSNTTITQHGGEAGIEIEGDYHVVDHVTIKGPSGWNNTRSGSYLDGDGIRVNNSTGTVIKDTVVHDIWEMYAEYQHTDSIQFWTGVYNLVIDRSVLGTWQPNGHQSEIGPTQCIMAGTVPAGGHVDFTVRNSLFLGTGQANGVAINSSAGTGAVLQMRLINNTFWSARPSLNAGAYLRNNVFKNMYIYPTDLAIDSDYNLFLSASQKPAKEGAHSIVAADPGFVNPDVSATTAWGLNADFHPKATSPLVGKGDPTAAPTIDKTGAARVGTPDIGAFE